MSEIATELGKILEPYFSQVETITRELRVISESLSILKLDANHRAENLAAVIVLTQNLQTRIEAVEVKVAVLSTTMSSETAHTEKLKSSLSQIVTGVIMLIIGGVCAALWRSS